MPACIDLINILIFAGVFTVITVLNIACFCAGFLLCERKIERGLYAVPAVDISGAAQTSQEASSKAGEEDIFKDVEYDLS